MLRKLPLDIQTFSELRTSNYVYVDKTEHMYNMITGGRRFFLSRPRRFGKSLLVSTLKEILTANRALFDDLWIGKNDYHWNEYGVITLDLSLLVTDDLATFKHRLHNALSNNAKRYEIFIDPTITSPDLFLEKLVHELFTRFGRVALLVDEYDSPILKTLDNEPLAKSIRDALQQFFTIIKGLDAQIQFVFITGVSSFAKAGLFSGINNVQILSIKEEYAAICGYTDNEIDNYFSQHITSWAEKDTITYDTLRQQIKTWYNGYHFGANVTPVYNPFSLMNALNTQKFKNFWFQSGTPTFLGEILKKEHTVFDPEKLETTEESLGIFNVNNIPLIPLMFQAGYLTITGYDQDSQLYTLNYPNKEVQISFQKYLLEVYAHINPFTAEQLSVKIKAAFNNQTIDEAVQLLKQLFAHIPYQLHIKEEKFYHALLMMVCVGANINAQSEYSTSHGRIDLVLDLPKVLYVIEIKFNVPAEIALAQIEERRYYERFLTQNKPLLLLGLSFIREPGIFNITYVLKKMRCEQEHNPHSHH